MSLAICRGKLGRSKEVAEWHITLLPYLIETVLSGRIIAHALDGSGASAWYLSQDILRDSPAQPCLAAYLEFRWEWHHSSFI